MTADKQFRAWRWLLCIALMFAGTGAASEVGQVTQLEGGANVLRGQAPTISLALQSAIHEQDVLRTQVQSFLEVTMVDKSRLTLAENSRLDIATFVVTGEPKGLLSLTRGRMRAVITDVFSKRSESLKVKTPTAIAGVMGTDFIVEVHTRFTRVLVIDGVVVVSNVDPNIPQRQILKRGQSTVIREGEPPDPPFHVRDLTGGFPKGSGEESDDDEDGGESDKSGEEGGSGDGVSQTEDPIPPESLSAPPGEEPPTEPPVIPPIEPPPGPGGGPQPPPPAPPSDPPPPGRPDGPPGPPPEPPGQAKKE